MTKYYREDTIFFDEYFRCGTVGPGSTASEEIFDGRQTLETFLVYFVICRTEFEGSRLGLGIRKVKEASTTKLPSTCSDISICQIYKLVHELATYLSFPEVPSIATVTMCMGEGPNSPSQSQPGSRGRVEISTRVEKS